MVWKRPVWDTIWAQFGHKFVGAVVNDIPFPNRYALPTIPPSEWGPAERDRLLNCPLYEQRDHYLLTVHGFDAGGYEATVRCVDAQKMQDMRMRPRGMRKPIDERKPTDMLRAVARAKKTVRHAVKQIGCDHLLTLTTRQDENDPQELARQWKEFARRYRKYSGEDFPYVGVPERHPSNPKHWHLHIAIRGRLKLNIARQIWWNVCGGRGMGNVDVRYIKISADPVTGLPRGPLVRSEKIARYISKYMTKDLLFAHRPDKKRYWRSEFDLPAARRYWLRARPDYSDSSLDQAFSEMRVLLGGFCPTKCSVFVFPDGSGFWLSYNPDNSAFVGFADPPPF